MPKNNNYSNDFLELVNDNMDNNIPIGWSAACIDDTISYYIEYSEEEQNNIVDENLDKS